MDETRRLNDLSDEAVAEFFRRSVEQEAQNLRELG